MDASVPDELLVGHRMYVDNEFTQRVLESGFSSAEWDIIMSVVSFRVHAPDEPEEATLYPAMDGLPDAIAATDELPDFQTVQHTQPRQRSGGRVSRFVTQLRESLGLDFAKKRDRHERVQAAEKLVSDYTEVLEIHLRQQSRWDDICQACVDQVE